MNRAQALKSQIFVTRVQYSHIGIEVSFNKDRQKIETEIYAVMKKKRYKQKNYDQKIRDCNQVRNLILYKNNGYKFFTQKRDPSFSEEIMEEIFKEIFFENINLNEQEINFLLNNMFIKVTIYHPIKKKELSCLGKINDYELK